MSKRDKLLVLGSDLGTIDIVNEFHQLGGYVITTDLMDTSPTRLASDESWGISTQDIEELTIACKKNDITAVLAGASDKNVDAARKLCKALGLPTYCVDDDAYEVARDKSKFKKICKKVGAPIATDYKLTDELKQEDLDKIEYPVVIKPVNLSGNRGMSFCNNQNELIEAYKKVKSMSDKETIICERKLHGPEWDVEYLLAEGEAKIFIFSKEHHQPGEKACLYSIMNTTSNYLKKYIEECDEAVKRVFKEAGFKDGIAWVEIMLDEDGHFYLLECGHRLGSDVLYTFYNNITGFNSIKWFIEAALGKFHAKEELPDIKNLNNTKSSVAYSLFSKREGNIRISGLDKIQSLPNIIMDIPRRNPRKVNQHELMGAIRLFGTAEEVVDTLKIINNHLVIQDDNGEDMLIRYTDYDAFMDDFNNGLIEFGKIEY